ncbi:CheR family methyltransferase [Spirosoma validum]|uniref:CheR family methyltransferase n=1 Tax=Spirosoma validum TaxID=2771355 RepID=UPI00293BE40D|nr:CheR family methyltransferase [Spirosoma validum]
MTELLVVGIGASAGGVEALTQFFKQVTPDSGLAYVVILHLSPDYDSQLTQILQDVASIPVSKVDERVEVVANHVYVVPPNKHLQMDEGHLVVLPNTQIEDRRAPVDIFFRTLAESHQELAIGVILSGTGANGSMGLKRIKERGGAVFVQNPRQATFNEMPRHAIATDLVDDILPVEEIPARLLAYAQSRGTLIIPLEPSSNQEDQQAALREVFTQLRVRTGHDFTNYKRPTMLRRIERRLNVRNLPDLPAYVSFLREHPEEIQALLKDLLISVTNFFRDSPVFTTLEHQLISILTHSKTQDNTLRIWVAGCATGEEAYSLAMLFAERTLDIVDAPNVQIFATDLDETALNTARDGLYTLNDAADVSPERLRRFFTKEGESYRVRPEIREMVLFAHHNVLKDPPFSRLNLISCRNLLIYFNQTAQQRALETFHFALNPGGYLLLGLAETTDGTRDLYAPVHREHHLFQSRSVAPRAYPVPEISAGIAPAQKRGSEATLAQENPSNGRLSYGELHHQVLEQYGPPSILANEALDILHVSDRAGRYLQVGGGEPSKNLLQLIQSDLRLELRSAFYRAVQQRTPVVVPRLTVRLDGQVQTITLHVRPVLGEGDPARGFILVLFEPTTEESDTLTRERSPVEPMAHQLEEELIRAKAQLRLANEQHELQAEELKAANEELQAINEELRSSAEELETSKEELQSINEELTTINQEMKIKLEEISLASNNLQNLINATDIATLFLDRSLRVNLFTPATRTIFNLIATDTGRPLSDITSRLDYLQLQVDAEAVLATLQPIEREVRSTDGRVYMGRIFPYRTSDDRINGLVLTFVDITQRKKAEEANYFLASIVESSQDSVLTVNFAGLITSWNQAAESLYGYPAEEAIGQPLSLLTMPQDLVQMLRNVEKIKLNQRVETYETIRVNKAGQSLDLEVVLSPVKDATGQVIGLSTVARDITQRKAVEEALRESDRRKDEFLAMLAHELRNPLAPVRHTLQTLGLSGGQTETMSAAIALMNRQVNQLVRLVDDLLDVSRINQGKITLQLERLDLKALLADALDDVRPLFEARHIELSISLPSKSIYLSGDAARLTQVMTNLLTNGARYTPEGGQVWVSLDQVIEEPNHSMACLRVRDTGIGLAADQLERIFELFAQVDNSLARTKGGLGLGLTLVKRLVELHGGRVEARSEGLGLGSEFLVYLPVLPVVDPSIENTSIPVASPISGRRILVVDDNQDAADSFALLLELTGYTVEVCYSGQQALEAAEQLQPDVILLDIGMPGLDGYETARLIRQQAWGRHLILIALTGYGQADDKRQSQEAGFDGHLVKPVELEAVSQLLDSFVPPGTTA